MSKIVLLNTVIGPTTLHQMLIGKSVALDLPVTPAIVRGWAPNTANMKAAMNDDRSTSATPYCSVVSMRSRENAIPGRTLRHFQYSKYGMVHRYTDLAKNIRTVAGTTL